MILIGVSVTPRGFLIADHPGPGDGPWGSEPVPSCPRHTGDVGFDPNRKYNATTFDYALVAISILVAAGLTAWAFFG